MPREAVSSEALPPPVGPFSPGVRVGELLLLSGQGALDPKTGKLIDGDGAAQTAQVLENLCTLLGAAGKSLADVARTNVYLTDMKDFARMNASYARYFEPPYPARTTVAVAALPLGAAVEIDLIAR
ncbi:MAG: RidA family protein [Sinobacteraceae bacterium]|nr:RidA family protein [Nevskiaceae bacterium]